MAKSPGKMLRKRLKKARKLAKASGGAAVAGAPAFLVKGAVGPSSAEVVDASTALAHVSTVAVRHDGDVVLTKAAAVVLAAGVADQVLSKVQATFDDPPGGSGELARVALSRRADISEYLEKARGILALTPSQRRDAVDAAYAKFADCPLPDLGRAYMGQWMTLKKTVEAIPASWGAQDGPLKPEPVRFDPDRFAADMQARMDANLAAARARWQA